jgi:cytochrome b
MLSLLLLQTGSGLFSSDSISVEGPLSHLLRDASISWLTWLHVTLQWVLYALVSLHVMAICFYYFAKKINLTRAMLTGYKTGIETPMATDNRWVRVIGLTLLSGSIVVLLYLWG